MYRVTNYFTDLQDGDHTYNEGDTFPRDGVTVTADRIKELSTSANRRGIALIEEVRGAEETETISNTETVEPDETAPVEDEPRKRTRKHKEAE
jgi:hypothetical protein